MTGLVDLEFLPLGLFLMQFFSQFKGQCTAIFRVCLGKPVCHFHYLLPSAGELIEAEL
jgi:hypothetical protein